MDKTCDTCGHPNHIQGCPILEEQMNNRRKVEDGSYDESFNDNTI